MLDTELRRRLLDEADRIEVGEPPVGRLASRARRRSGLRRSGALLAIVALLGGAFVVGRVVTAPEPAPHSFIQAGRGPTSPELSEEQDLLPAPMPGAFSPIVPGDRPGARAAPEGIGVGPRIVKTGSLRLEVPDGSFGEARERAQRIVASHDGFVTASATSGEQARSGVLTLRVPEASFEETVADLKGLGTVRGERLRGEDVTSRFLDLKARLRHWRAQERVLLGLMGEATTIAESIRVQDELQRVQLEIERIRGQLRVLGDRTSLATIHVTIREAGVVAPAEAGALGTAWQQAIAGAVDVVAAIIVGLGYLIPIAAVVAIMWLAVRAVRSRRSP